jgi:hypothetical protein
MREKSTNTPIIHFGVYVGFSSIFLLGTLNFEGLTARRLCKSFGVKGLITRIPTNGVISSISIDSYLRLYDSEGRRFGMGNFQKDVRRSNSSTGENASLMQE